jgi:putative DNA primase/helicase
MKENNSNEAFEADVIVNVDAVDAKRTYNDIIHTTTVDYLSTLDKTNLPSPREIENELIHRTNRQIALRNSCIPRIEVKGENGKTKTILQENKMQSIITLAVKQISEILVSLRDVISIDTIGDNNQTHETLVGYYVNDPTNPKYGLYDTNELALRRLAEEYDVTMCVQKFDGILKSLKLKAPRMIRCCDRDLVPVDNGIFNYKTKKLENFTPDKVFIIKIRIPYNPNAFNPKILEDDGSIWDVENWMQTLSNDPEIVELFWQILSCIVRPFVRWNKSVWLYSTKGNNGKGTLCLLARNLCGKGNHTSIPLANFDKDFALEPLLHSQAIIVDENNVGDFIECSGNLKAIPTNDVIQINRKYQKIISFRFWGFMIQCINDLPRARDKSNSFYRRQIIIPMEKCFTDCENKNIKDDYLNRPNVLEYVLYKVLNTDFYEINVPEKCRALLEGYKQSNDSVRDFIAEFENRFVWDVIPWDFLHDLYVSWYKRFNPSGKPEGKTTFKGHYEDLLEDSTNWEAIDDDKKAHIGRKMENPELLIAEYNLERWKNCSYKGSDPNKICKTSYSPQKCRGIKRRK